jgi:hypothetical protein
MAFQTQKTINDLILSAMRKVNGYSDGDIPTQSQVADAFNGFLDVISRAEADGVRLFQREWRTKVISPPSWVTGTDGIAYRCIQSHTSVNASAWVQSTTYASGSCVFPTVYNGYYYEAQSPEVNPASPGVSSTVEPTWVTIQEHTVTDGTVTWVAVPDTKPVVGVNYRDFWVEDVNPGVATTYAKNTYYFNSGTFSLKDDEAFILQAYCQLMNWDTNELELVSSNQYEKIALKWMLGVPSSIYIERTGPYSSVCHINPIPQKTGVDGYVVKYEVLKKVYSQTSNQGYPDASDDSPFPEYWNSALTWGIVSEIQSEYSIDWQVCIYNDKKAQKFYKEAIKRDQPRVTRRRIANAF